MGVIQCPELVKHRECIDAQQTSRYGGEQETELYGSIRNNSEHGHARHRIQGQPMTESLWE